MSAHNAGHSMHAVTSSQGSAHERSQRWAQGAVTSSQGSAHERSQRWAQGAVMSSQ